VKNNAEKAAASTTNSGLKFLGSIELGLNTALLYTYDRKLRKVYSTLDYMQLPFAARKTKFM
jgi:hypothetical protein